MTRLAWPSLLALSAALVLAGAPRTAAADSKDQAKVEKERQKVRKTKNDILKRLYKAEPPAKAVIARSAGYAVFANKGTKILVAGAGGGQGVAIDSKTGKETFMRMVELQAGLGFGVKKFSLIWVFDQPEKLADFISGGMELGGQSSAALKAGDKGGSMEGAIAVTDGVWLYQLTDAGVALELTVKGTKYKIDEDLM